MLRHEWNDKVQSALPRRVLVVEDTKVVQEALRVILEDEGYEVITATGGNEALRLAVQCAPHAVTLDLSLPDLDGREVLRRMKTDSRTQDVPVIILSTFIESLGHQDRARAASVLSKPFDVEELLGCVERITA